MIDVLQQICGDLRRSFCVSLDSYWFGMVERFKGLRLGLGCYDG